VSGKYLENLKSASVEVWEKIFCDIFIETASLGINSYTTLFN